MNIGKYFYFNITEVHSSTQLAEEAANHVYYHGYNLGAMMDGGLVYLPKYLPTLYLPNLLLNAASCAVLCCSCGGQFNAMLWGALLMGTWTIRRNMTVR